MPSYRAVWTSILALFVSLFGILALATSSGAAKSSLVTAGASSGCPSTACSAVLSAVARAVHINTVPANLTPALQHAAADMNMPAGYVNCEGNLPIAQTPTCIIGSPQASIRIALFGDSHARMWSTAIATIAANSGASLLLLVRDGCPISSFAFADEGTIPPATCSAWIANSIQRVASFNPTMVIVTSDASPGDMRTLNNVPVSKTEYEKGLDTILKKLVAPARRLVILGDIPYLAQDGPDCLAAHESRVQACSTPTSIAIHTTEDLWQEAAGKKEGAQYIDTVPWLCTKTECPAVIGNIEVYEGLYHITATYADYLEPVLQQALGLNAAGSK
jgi:hypothetical protein